MQRPWNGKEFCTITRCYFYNQKKIFIQMSAWSIQRKHRTNRSPLVAGTQSESSGNKTASPRKEPFVYHTERFSRRASPKRPAQVCLTFLEAVIFFTFWHLTSRTCLTSMCQWRTLCFVFFLEKAVIELMMLLKLLVSLDWWSAGVYTSDAKMEGAWWKSMLPPKWEHFGATRMDCVLQLSGHPRAPAIVKPCAGHWGTELLSVALASSQGVARKGERPVTVKYNPTV